MKRALGALALACASCAPAAPRALLLPPTLASAEPCAPPTSERAALLLGRAQAYERATGDFTAVLSMTLRDLDGDREFAARGALAVRRPELLRMQLTGPGGVTALDVLVRGAQRYHRLGTGSWTAGEPPRVPLGVLSTALLGLPWSRAELVCDRALATARMRDGERILEATFDARDGALRELRFLRDGAEPARVRLEALRPVGELRMPSTVLFWQRSPAVLATLTLEPPRLAPTLPEATFAPPPLH